MKVGFSGTRKGMTPYQQLCLYTAFGMTTGSFGRAQGVGRTLAFHHGGARGADTQAAYLAVPFFGAERVYVHEPEGDDSPLVRNRLIVSLSQILIIAPESDKEVLRSGTWATARYAREAGIPVIHLPRGGREQNSSARSVLVMLGVGELPQ